MTHACDVLPGTVAGRTGTGGHNGLGHYYYWSGVLIFARWPFEGLSCQVHLFLQICEWILKSPECVILCEELSRHGERYYRVCYQQNAFKRRFYFYFMCSHVLPPLYIALHVPRTYREGFVESLGDWSYRGCEPSYEFCDSNPDLLEDQPLLLTKESSLQFKGSKGGDAIAPSQSPACRLWFSPSGT